MLRQIQTASLDPQFTQTRLALGAGGMLRGTRVETAKGWRAVETLAAGDRVQTLDGGLREIVDIVQTGATGPSGHTAPHVIEVPGGVLDTCANLTVLAETRLLLDLPAAEDPHGTPLVLIPAAALEGWQGIHRGTAQPSTASITLVFAEEEVVFAQTGAMIHCPAPLSVSDAETAPLWQETWSEFFPVLDYSEARRLLGLGFGPQPVPAALPGGLRLVQAA